MTKNEVITDNQSAEWRWRIVQNRNKDFDGALFFGVSSTGIYCKPSCAARRPKRENIRFFTTCAEAETAGFRACLRCRPQAADAPNAELVRQACEIIKNNLEDEVSLEVLAEQLKVSPSHLQRTFKNALGVSPKEFSEARRFENFKEQVRQSDVPSAMYDSGFGSSRQLYEKAERHLGMTPRAYQKGGKGSSIRFATADTEFGKLLVAATEKGVCCVAFGASDEELTANLIEEFSRA